MLCESCGWITCIGTFKNIVRFYLLLKWNRKNFNIIQNKNDSSIWLSKYLKKNHPNTKKKKSIVSLWINYIICQKKSVESSHQCKYFKRLTANYSKHTQKQTFHRDSEGKKLCFCLNDIKTHKCLNMKRMQTYPTISVAKAVFYF